MVLMTNNIMFFINSKYLSFQKVSDHENYKDVPICELNQLCKDEFNLQKIISLVLYPQSFKN